VGSQLPRAPGLGPAFDSAVRSFIATDQLAPMKLGSTLSPTASPFLDELYGRGSLSSALTKRHVVNVFCAGDDDQSIYAWRGAQAELMRKFRFDFPNAKVLRLLRIILLIVKVISDYKALFAICFLY